MGLIAGGAIVGTATASGPAAYAECNRVDYYQGSAYMYSACGSYFCYDGQCQNVDPGPRWAGGGYNFGPY